MTNLWPSKKQRYKSVNRTKNLHLLHSVLQYISQDSNFGIRLHLNNILKFQFDSESKDHKIFSDVRLTLSEHRYFLNPDIKPFPAF